MSRMWKPALACSILVVNASPDSLNEESKISGADEMRPKVTQLLRDGADAIDLGGAGSTPQAARVGMSMTKSLLARSFAAHRRASSLARICHNSC